ncbi:hypothetical protein D3C72_1491240 [compost metagenome]
MENFQGRLDGLLFLSFLDFHQDIAAVKFFGQDDCWYPVFVKGLAVEVFDNSHRNNLQIFIQYIEFVYPELLCCTFGNKGIVDIVFIFGFVSFDMRIVFGSQQSSLDQLYSQCLGQI